MIAPITIATPDQPFTALTWEPNPAQPSAHSADKPPLLLLVHGFPDTPHSFRYQLEFFGDLGYRVIAPWLRGYAPSALAADGNYSVTTLGNDLLQIMDALGYEQADVIGHDWGAGAAYAAATITPERIDHLITCALPYGPGLMQSMVTNGDQQRRSWYLFFFQTPLAEQAMVANDFALVKRLWREWAAPDWSPDETVITAVLECFNNAGSVEAALQYYRQVFSVPPPDQYRPIAVPTLTIHGEQDGCIGVELATPDPAIFTGGCEYYRIAGAGHFVHLEKPGEFNHRVAEFIAA